MRARIAPQYIPHQHQLRFHRSKRRFVCAAAGVRGGKTYASCVEFVRRIYKDATSGKGRIVTGIGKRRRPSLHYWIVAPTAALLREPWRYLFEIVPRRFIEVFYESENALWLNGGILIEGKTADNPRNLVASGLDGMLIDEAARVKADAWKGQLRQRLSDHLGWCLFASTPMGRNWLYEDIVLRSHERKGGDPEFDTISWTTADNEHIARTEIEAARRQLPVRYFQREYLASFDAFLGNVYDEFSEPTHVITEAQLRAEYGWPAHRPLRELFRRVVAGVDWGWTSPGAIAVIGDTGRERILLEESYAANRLIYDPRDEENTWVGAARVLMLKWGISQFFYDPSAPQYAHDFERSGLPVTGAFNEIGYGIRKVTEQLHPIEGKPRMRVLNTCTNFIREARAYVWDQTRGHESYKESPAPNQSDHCLDAARYAIVELVKYEDASSAGGADERRGRAGRPLG